MPTPERVAASGDQSNNRPTLRGAWRTARQNGKGPLVAFWTVYYVWKWR